MLLLLRRFRLRLSPSSLVVRRHLFAVPTYPHEPPVPLDRQSVLLPGPDRVRASALLRDPERLVWRIPGAEHIDSCYHLLQHGQDVSGDGMCVGSRAPDDPQYKWRKYSEVSSLSQHVGSGLLELGLQQQQLVAIFATNNEEFLLTMCGCAAYSLVSVPIYLQTPMPSILFILQQGALEVVVVESPSRAQALVEHADQLPSLRTIVCCSTTQPLPASPPGGPTIISFQQLQEKGRSNPKPLRLPGPDDLFCIPYTSGTTGTPKGVMLTHKNLVACASSLRMAYGPAGKFGGTIISYLPPAHIYEIANQLVGMYFGRRVAYYAGDVRNLMDEIRLVKPDVLPLVPRLMNPLYAKALSGIKGSFLKSLLLDIGLRSAERRVLRGSPQRRTWLDRLLFSDFRASLGGNAFIVTTTSAPLAPHVMRFFRRAASAYLIECYGQTEMLGATMTLPNDIEGGYVGAPLPCNHLKLVDVPEMGYFAKDDVGEICIRGPNVFRGYFRDEKATRDSLVDGWQHTGDVGRWLPNGALQIIDRKKHLFKLSQGEYIAPEKIESAYAQSELVAQIFVDGFPHENFVVALIVPEPNALRKWLDGRPLQDKEVKREFLRELHRVGERLHLNRLEQVRGVALLSEPFGPHLITPTLKLKRLEARRAFHDTISALYREGPLL